MASSSMMLSSQTPHFFKVIVANTLTNGTLTIPKKFVSENRGYLVGNQVHLTLPGGKWRVELKNDAGKFWLERGWPEFMEFHSVQLYDFVVFRCEGNCNFHVVILNPAATEIQYPVKDNVILEPEPLIPIIEDEDEDEDEYEDEDEDYDSSVEIPISMSWGKRKSHGNKKTMKKKKEPTPSKQSLMAKQELVKRATGFLCGTETPSFMVTMRPSYFQTGSYLSLPRGFADIHLQEPKEVKIKVMGGGGRSWKVWCGIRWAYNRRRVEFRTGWKKFAVDNNLEQGDICVFQMIASTDFTISMQATLFRHN